ALALFEGGVHALKVRLPDYAGRFWSSYDSRRSSWSGPAPPFYQLLHGLQLRALARITAERDLEEVAGEWETQLDSLAGMAAYSVGRHWHRARRRLVRHRFSAPHRPEDVSSEVAGDGTVLVPTAS
ncbi:MAG TPA: D-glucuronyl C5-epimerase family protein, partial [Acidimicrobiales bacterium]|nr:D-glucuronyl C5-epimerase family protein [Acidimicrobiales bacterium]